LDTREQRCEESASAIRRAGSLVVTFYLFPVHDDSLIPSGIFLHALGVA
jgi:hypothetical protein